MNKKPSHEIEHDFNRAVVHSTAKRHSLFSVEVDYSADCLSPPVISRYGHPMPDGLLLKDRLPREVIKHVRCRKCRNCLAANAKHWAARAVEEALAASGRTWAVTLTGTPSFHARHSMACGADSLDERDAFSAMVKSEGEDLKRALKRLRERLGVAPRRLFVAEPHQSNFPHWHGLIHEPAPNAITKRMLSGDPDAGIESFFWPHGIIHARLCAEEDIRNAVWYCCKYLKKSYNARTRASLKYGK